MGSIDRIPESPTDSCILPLRRLVNKNELINITNVLMQCNFVRRPLCTVNLPRPFVDHLKTYTKPSYFPTNHGTRPSPPRHQLHLQCNLIQVKMRVRFQNCTEATRINFPPFSYTPSRSVHSIPTTRPYPCTIIWHDLFMIHKEMDPPAYLTGGHQSSVPLPGFFPGIG